ncbi:MAG: carboxypeptidase-like regulatory domain-containing protein, partial [Thermoplasmata archaeon]
AVLSAALGAALAYDAWDAAQPASFTVDGTVAHVIDGAIGPLAGARVVLTNDANRSSTVVTEPGGAFSFTGVPSGGVTLNVTATGYAPITVTTFVSNVYLAQATDLELVLAPGTIGNGSTVALAPFPDLEQFVASVGSGAALLGLIALVAGTAAVATVRDDRPALGVVGGSAGLLAPIALVYLSLPAAVPLVLYGTALVAAAGAFTVALRAIHLAQTGPAPDPD